MIKGGLHGKDIRLRHGKWTPNSLEINLSHPFRSIGEIGEILCPSPMRNLSKAGRWTNFRTPGTGSTPCPPWWSCSPSALCAQWVAWQCWLSSCLCPLRPLCGDFLAQRKVTFAKGAAGFRSWWPVVWGCPEEKWSSHLVPYLAAANFGWKAELLGTPA